MAKSKNGGTRSYLRGRIANDVYSIGKDSAGRKQQVVRSLAEQVTNPRTSAQMRGRMIMSTVMQVVSQLSSIVDHSFDGFAAGQPSISEFIRRAYSAVKADVAANPSSGNKFGLNLYQEKGAKAGQYVVSDGSAVMPAVVGTAEGKESSIIITLPAAAPTVQQAKTALGVAAGDYFTKVLLLANGTAAYFRALFVTALADDTVITDANAAQLFTVNGNVAATVAFAASGSTSTLTITPTLSADVVAHGIIVSQQKGGSWIHSNTVLALIGTPTYTADVALPTFPTGTERYLNGGDVAGLINSGEGTADGGGTDSGSGDGGSSGGGGAPEDDDNGD